MAGAKRTQNRHSRTRRTDEVPHIHATPGATLCEKTQGFMRFLTPKHHLDTAVPLRSAITALQITLQLRRPQLKSTRWMQPLHCKLQHKITKPSGTAQSTISWLGLKMHFTMAGAKRTQNQHSRTRRTDEVPHIDAGSHFVRKNIEFRAIPKHHLYAAVPMRSALTALQITLQLRRPPRQSTRWMQSFQCKLQHSDTSQSMSSLTFLKVTFTMT